MVSYRYDHRLLEDVKDVAMLRMSNPDELPEALRQLEHGLGVGHFGSHIRHLCLVFLVISWMQNSAVRS